MSFDVDMDEFVELQKENRWLREQLEAVQRERHVALRDAREFYDQRERAVEQYENALKLALKGQTREGEIMRLKEQYAASEEARVYAEACYLRECAEHGDTKEQLEAERELVEESYRFALVLAELKVRTRPFAEAWLDKYRAARSIEGAVGASHGLKEPLGSAARDVSTPAIRQEGGDGDR